jgi:hypothetical protein
MKLRTTMALLPFLVFGCGTPPDESSAVPDIVTGYEDGVPQGFFTDLTLFWDVDDIQRIGTRDGAVAAGLDRLNNRYDLIIGSHKEQLKGARVLDFGSYDGHWAYAALDAGAKHVTGIEINKDYAAKAERNFNELGVSPDSYNFIVGDVLEELQKIQPGEFDGVICAGIYYHIDYHVQLMRELRRIGVDWIIVDSAVVLSERPIIQWSDGPNGIEGTPSLAAIKKIAEEFDFEYTQLPSTDYDTPGMWDYRMNGRITMLIY